MSFIPSWGTKSPTCHVTQLKKFFLKLLYRSQDGPPSLTAGARSRARPCVHFTQDGALGTPDSPLHPDSYMPWMRFLSTHPARPRARQVTRRAQTPVGETRRVPQVSSSPRQAIEEALRRSEAVGTLTAPPKLAWAAASDQGEGQGCSPASGAGAGMGCGGDREKVHSRHKEQKVMMSGDKNVCFRKFLD